MLNINVAVPAYCSPTLLDFFNTFLEVKLLKAAGPPYQCRRQNRCINYQFNWVQKSEIHSHNTGLHSDLYFPRSRTIWGKQRYVYQAVVDWNKLKFIPWFTSFIPQLIIP